MQLSRTLCFNLKLWFKNVLLKLRLLHMFHLKWLRENKIKKTSHCIMLITRRWKNSGMLFSKRVDYGYHLQPKNLDFHPSWENDRNCHLTSDQLTWRQIKKRLDWFFFSPEKCWEVFAQPKRGRWSATSFQRPSMLTLKGKMFLAQISVNIDPKVQISGDKQWHKSHNTQNPALFE